MLSGVVQRQKISIWVLFPVNVLRARTAKSFETGLDMGTS